MVCPVCATANPPGMRFCGMCGRALAASVERERRRASVLFVDLTGFSKLTQGLDPEELRDLADHVLTVVAGVIQDYDGYVDAFRGDGLIAVFGAPRSHPDDPYRAVLAGEASLQAIERAGRERGLDLHGRAGVATGVVIAGAVGSGRVREYTVMGSTVNLASRLEQAAGAGEVWASGETFQATRHRLTYESIENVSLPGFAHVTSAYRLVARRVREHDPYAHLPFVGRRRELALLADWHQGVARRRLPQVVWLQGETGSGKSRLMREFAARIGADGRVAPEPVARVPGSGSGHAVDGWPRAVFLRGDPVEGTGWQAVGRQLFGFAEGDDERSRREIVRRGLDALLPADPRQSQLLLASLGLATEPPWRRLERRAVDRKLVAWRDVVVACALAGRGPLTLLAESEYLAPEFEVLLELLAEAEAPLLVLRAARGRELPEDASTLALDPLSPEECMALFLQVADPTYERAGRALIDQVGGVPASVFELGLALAITQDTQFRGSLTSLLQTRLDMLEPRARRLLVCAALCGEHSWEGVLAAVHGGDVREDLRALRRANVLVRQPTSTLPGEVEYRFRSELLRHAVLEMTARAAQPALHLEIASWLEERAPLALSELVAEHFERGGAHEAAYAHRLAAAAEAEAAHDPARADQLFTRLSELAVGPDLRAQGALAYAEAALARGDAELAGRQLDSARATLADCAGEPCPQLRLTAERLAADLDALRRQGGQRRREPAAWAATASR